jgi:uncharacterized protein (DUF58 family)
LPALVGLLLILQLAFPYRGWVILLAGLGAAWLSSYLWARSLIRGLRLRREMRFGWAQVGDRLQERFTLTNTGWAPALWVEVLDHSTLPGYKASTVRHVGSWQVMQWHSEGVCTRRGVFTLGPTSVQTGDPFGIYTAHLDYPQSLALMVTPPVVPLPRIEVAPGGRAGAGRRPNVNTLESMVSAAGVREYDPGDSLRRVHWPLSAHRDELVVRLLDNSPASDWWILLDLDRHVQAGEGWDSTEEHAVTLAASLASRGFQVGRAVGLAAQGQELVWLPPQGGEGQHLLILQALALVKPGERPLADLLYQGCGTSPSGRRASLVVITPAVEGDWVEALASLLQRGVVPTVLLLDPISYGGMADARRILHVLAEMGVARYIITRDFLDQPEARPGQQGQWEWRVTPLGHAVPVRRPVDTVWKRLA